jgi:hypothetical protein
VRGAEARAAEAAALVRALRAGAAFDLGDGGGGGARLRVRARLLADLATLEIAGEAAGEAAGGGGAAAGEAAGGGGGAHEVRVDELACAELDAPRAALRLVPRARGAGAPTLAARDARTAADWAAGLALVDAVRGAGAMRGAGDT